MPKFFGKNCRGGDDRPGQRTTTGFVNSRNPRDPCDTEFFLVTKSAAPMHPHKSLADLRE